MQQLQLVVGADVKYSIFSNTTTSTNIFEQYMKTEMACSTADPSQITALALGVAAGSVAVLAVVVVLLFVRNGRRKRKYETIRN